MHITTFPNYLRSPLEHPVTLKETLFVNEHVDHNSDTDETFTGPEPRSVIRVDHRTTSGSTDAHDTTISIGVLSGSKDLWFIKSRPSLLCVVCTVLDTTEVL